MPSDSRRNTDKSDSTNRKDSSRGKPSRSSWREGSSSSREPQHDDQQSRPGSDASYGVGHKWRDRQRGEQPDDAGLPDLPGQRGKKKSGGGVGSRAIVFGALLLVVVAALIFLPFSPLLDESDPEPTPTASVIAEVTATAESNAGGDETAVPTHESADTVESDFLVCIDPGHGGWDFGRERLDQETFPAPWFHESEVTLPMSLMLRDELENRGIAVVMTRESGGAVNWANEDVNGDGQVMDNTPQGEIAGQRDELQARINICNEAEADIMISVHLNGADDQSASGYQVFWNGNRGDEMNQQNLDLATFIFREMGDGFADQGYDANPRGATQDIDLNAATHEYGSEQFLIMIGPRVQKPEYTIEPTNMPGVIIETLFVTNQDDANFIINPANQSRIVQSWADGIEQYRDRYGDGS